MTPRAPTHLLVGPRTHGVVAFGRDLQPMLAAAVPGMRLRHLEHLERLGGVDGPLHLQFTDRLFGCGAVAAGSAVAELAAAAHTGGHTVSVTLHDMPQPSDGRHFATRCAGYRAVCAAVDAVVVNSEHERALLAEHLGDVGDAAVIPLPVGVAEPGPAATVRAGNAATVGVLGYVYPGKGHAEVIDAVAGLDVQVLALGAASDGHTDLTDALHAAAAARGCRFDLTGYLPAPERRRWLRAVTVPVVAHRHFSASGTLGDWLRAGRRPLAPQHRYTREVLDRNPGSLHLYPEGGLREAIVAALADPRDTVTARAAVWQPTVATVARRYAEVFARCHR